ncbi:MAG TPA: NAD(P)/FAD-dependent oxidoreductase [Terriglobales bacterium]|nr:NAD(P)/FAD-dependent oxidoreductase [Terriglobales bacterium]
MSQPISLSNIAVKKKKTAVIIGAGPAGLTAAYEFLTRSDVQPVVLEKSTYMGGISRTVNYKGNRMDLGPHRFFSKSDRVMDWWLQHLSMAQPEAGQQTITYHNQSREVPAGHAAPAAAGSDEVMLLCQRKTRIYYLRKFFTYPIQLSLRTLRNLGITRSLRIIFSYLRSVMFPPKVVETLEQFLIERFGRELYLTFFKSYTEKVWGVPCDQISAEWGAQRIKGLSIKKAIAHFVKQIFKKSDSVAQKGTETSLIEQFLYPKLGAGQMWETVAKKVLQMGGEIISGFDVRHLHCAEGRIVSVAGVDQSGEWREIPGDFFFSTMPVKELITALDAEVPENVKEVSQGLLYRDFITVGLLLNKLKITSEEKGRKVVDDSWIYIQEPEVIAGRLQVYNNWGPGMVADPEKVWIGVEYFCYESDDLWKLPDAEMAEFARQELAKIGIIDAEDVLDSTVLRMPKTYPAYFGTYSRFNEVREYIDGFENLFLVGRNGMHKYNNQDHSMLTAMVAVDKIVAGDLDKEEIWQVNTEMEYHETKTEKPQAQAAGAGA